MPDGAGGNKQNLKTVELQILAFCERKNSEFFVMLSPVLCGDK